VLSGPHGSPLAERVLRVRHPVYSGEHTSTWGSPHEHRGYETEGAVHGRAAERTDHGYGRKGAVHGAAVVELARKDTVLAFLDPVVRQAVAEFPAALSELREQLPVDNEPIGVLGGSLGGMVVLQILARPQLRIEAAELVEALRQWYVQPDHVQHTTVADLAHPLAEPPGLQPAPQLPTAKAVDEAMTQWFLRHLTAR
jgi:pimeloyl-ACP methyl ester carboxylesterase